MKKVFLQISMILLLFSSSAQDYHYWSDQFGIKPSALGGAVIAGIDDHAMVYYNPAAMSMIQNPSISISVNAYQYRTFKKKNAVGPGQDVNSSGFTTLPNMIAGVYAPKKYQKIRLGYHVLSTKNYNNKLDLLHRGDYEAVASTAGTERFVGTYGLHLTNSEYWAGIGVSYQVTPYLSFGLSHIGIYKSLTYTNLYQFVAQPEDPATGEISEIRSDISLNYYNIKAMFKPSVQLNFKKFRLGLTYTTPSFSIYGRGNIYREASVVNLNDVFSTDVSWIGSERKVKAKHKSSGSLGLGVSVHAASKLWIHLSGELFFAQKQYFIHDSKISPSTYPNYLNDSLTAIVFGDQKFLSFGEAYKSVINLGLGIEYNYSPTFSMQLGGRTDFNYNNNPVYSLQRLQIEGTQYDRLITSIGAAYRMENGRQFSLCFEFGFALPKTTAYEFDFTTPNETRNGLLGDRAMGSTTQAYSYRVMLGINLHKNDDAKKTKETAE